MPSTKAQSVVEITVQLETDMQENSTKAGTTPVLSSNLTLPSTLTQSSLKVPIRRTQHKSIPLAHVTNAINAWGYARTQTDLPMFHYTIMWDLSNKLGDTDSLTLHYEALKSIRRWLIRNGQSVYWLWVREYSKERGDHTHLLLFIDPALTEKLKAHIIKCCDFGSGSEGSMPVEVTGGNKTLSGKALGAYHLNAQAGLMRYILKQMVDKALFEGINLRDILDIDDREREAKTVIGKRIGVSQSISAKARSKDRSWPEAHNPYHLKDILDGKHITRH